MSEENVKIVRAAIQAFNAGDWEEVLSRADPDFEFDLSRGIGPDRGVYRRDQMPRYWTEFAAHWQTVRIEPHEFIEAGEHVVVAWSLRGVGRDGIEVETHVTWTWTPTDGKVMRVAYFPTREGALKAAGLSE